MAQQPGGIAGELQAARGADSGAIDRGSETAMGSLTNRLTKLRAELNETAEAFGRNFGPAIGLFIGLLTKAAGAANMFMNSPMGKLAAWAIAAAAPIAILAGTILTLAKALAAFAAVNQVINSGFVTGFKRQGAVTQPLPPRGWPPNSRTERARARPDRLVRARQLRGRGSDVAQDRLRDDRAGGSRADVPGHWLGIDRSGEDRPVRRRHHLRAWLLHRLHPAEDVLRRTDRARERSGWVHAELPR